MVGRKRLKKERGWYYHQIELQECFYENEYFDKKIKIV